ncbi:MAG TPA: transglutaminaseTgpA domain-containing protein, partial [Yinghuangia sp.]|nr:transglutaminaseTgpA domain-containing protein [Yinghuangia sp.]
MTTGGTTSTTNSRLSHGPWTPPTAPAPQVPGPQPASAAGSPAFVAPSPGAGPIEPKRRRNTRSKTPQQMQLRRMQWSLVPVAGLAAAVGLTYHRVFDMGTVLPVVAVAAVVPVLLVLAWSGTGRMNRPTGRPRPLLGSLAFGAIAWLVAVSATLYRDHALGSVVPGPALLRRIGGDVVDAPRGVLTTVLPASGDAQLLVLVSLSVWLAAYAGAELALRTHSVALPALPGLLLLAAPVVLSTGAPGDNTLAIAVAVGATGLILVGRAPGRRTPVRTLSVGVPLTAALAVLAAFAGPSLPGVGSPPDLRDQVSPPAPVRLIGVNPLDRISAWLLTPDQPLFTVEGAAPEDRYWRLAVMDRYDGTSWYPATELRPTGGRVPAAEGVEDAGARSNMQVTLDKLDGVWLPAADRPDRVSVPDDVDVAVDPASGVLATGDPLHPGLTYEVVSRVKEFDPDNLQFRAAAADPRYVELPEQDASSAPIPDVEEFRRIAIEATAGATFPYQQALRLEDWLRKNQRYDITAVPGHSYRNLRFFLESSKEGTSEQFAAAFAVLARTLGLPSRVVVGFSRGTATGPDTWRVDSGDVVAWPEVEFAGVGWVPFFPTPGEAGRSGTPKTDPGNAAPAPPQAPPAAAEEGEQSRAEKDQEIIDQVRPPAAAGQTPDTGDDGVALWWWAVPAALALVFASGHVTVAYAAPGIVRRRRKRGPPDRRVYGAWRQIA